MIVPALANWQLVFEATTVNPFEGSVDHFYLDTLGLVTTAKGCQLGMAEACALTMIVHGNLATPTQIANDYRRVSRLAAGHLTRFYLSNDSPRLSSLGIEMLVAKRIQSATALLRSMFSAFDTWPDEAKIATLEMPWGEGEYKFRTTYPHLRASLSTKDWKAAAAECAWNDPDGIYKLRNAARAARYLKAGSITASGGNA